MPYIPPPPRPPTPPRPFIPPAPRPNIHMQQQQRFQQQQQRFHQQQIFHQQQRNHQQQLQNQQRLQQNLQMDHMRRQQALQQQQQHFQRQQEIFRRQRQEQERIRQQNQQHQDRLRRDEEQRRQQQLLRNLQHTSATSVGEAGGTTVVHVAPGIQVELSGFSVNESPGAEGEFVAQPSTPLLSPTGVPPQSFESPPPYQQEGSAAAPPPTATYPPPAAVAPTNCTPPQRTIPLPSEHRVVLKDGTQIVMQQDDEILFVGPTGIQMVVNCLPLYMPPDDAVQAALTSNNSDESSEEQNETDSHKRGTKKSKNSPKKPHLRKAKSLTSIAIAEIELSDEERQSRSDNELLEDTPKNKKKKKSRMNSFGAHYSVKVHRQVMPKETIEETDAAFPVTSLEKSCDTEESVQSIDSTFQAKVEDKDASPAGNLSPIEPDEVVRKKPKSPVTKSKSTGSVPELEDASDPEDSKQGFQVNYLENTTTLPRLKRSSGSVSFPHRISMPVPDNNTIIVEESSVTSQLSNDPQPTLPAIPDYSLEEPKDSETSALADNEVSNTQECTDGPLNKTEEAETKAEGTEAPEQQPTPKPENESSCTSNVSEHTGNTESNEPVADVDVEQAKPIEDSAADTSPSSVDVPAASVQKDPPPVPGTQEPLTNSPTSNKSASLATASNSPPPSTPSQSTPPPLTFTPLPPSPVTINGEYVEKSGWLTKLSHRKGVFGDKWQKRYFVLNRSWLYYFKKYGDSNPKGVIRLLPTGWSKAVTQGTPRMPDAVVSSSDKGPGIMSVLRCLAVHRPNNFAAALSTLLEEDGVAEAFRSQTVSVSNPQHASRTFYVTASSNDERNAWVKAVSHNIQVFSHSAEALTTATKELKSMLRAVKSNIPPKDIPSLLLLLHTRKDKLSKTLSSDNSH